MGCAASADDNGPDASDIDPDLLSKVRASVGLPWTPGWGGTTVT